MYRRNDRSWFVAGNSRSPWSVRLDRPVLAYDVTSLSVLIRRRIIYIHEGLGSTVNTPNPSKTGHHGIYRQNFKRKYKLLLGNDEDFILKSTSYDFLTCANLNEILWSLNSLPAAKYLIWSTVLLLTCYRCNYLGVIHFEYIGSVRRDGKFAGSMINHFSQIVVMDEKANDSLCCEIQRGFCKVITYLFDFYFL